jgi:histone H3/H4
MRGKHIAKGSKGLKKPKASPSRQPDSQAKPKAKANAKSKAKAKAQKRPASSTTGKRKKARDTVIPIAVMKRIFKKSNGKTRVSKSAAVVGVNAIESIMDDVFREANRLKDTLTKSAILTAIHLNEAFQTWAKHHLTAPLNSKNFSCALRHVDQLALRRKNTVAGRGPSTKAQRIADNDDKDEEEAEEEMAGDGENQQAAGQVLPA